MYLVMYACIYVCMYICSYSIQYVAMHVCMCALNVCVYVNHVAITLYDTHYCDQSCFGYFISINW